MSIGDFPESLSQGILAGIILVGRLDPLLQRHDRVVCQPPGGIDGLGVGPCTSISVWYSCALLI